MRTSLILSLISVSLLYLSFSCGKRAGSIPAELARADSLLAVCPDSALSYLERMENPDKQWKITDEDWRNREKWDEYEKAVDEMLVRTSTTYAPWIIVEGNNKYYARVKVLRSVVNAMEERLGTARKAKKQD